MADRVHREIEDLLADLERRGKLPARPPRPPLRRRLVGPFARLDRAVSSRFERMTPGRALATGAILVLIGYFFRSFLGPAQGPVVIVGLVLFVGGFFWSFRAPRGPRVEQRWRGRVIDVPQPTIGQRLRRALRRGRR